MKQAYKKDYVGPNMYQWKPVHLTGLCKAVTGGDRTYTHRFYQARRTFFGILLWTYWIPDDEVKFLDPVVETIYKCECDK